MCAKLIRMSPSNFEAASTPTRARRRRWVGREEIILAVHARTTPQRSTGARIALAVVYIVFGVLYVAATLPKLPATLAAAGVGPGYMTAGFEALSRVAASWSATFETASYGETGRSLLQVAMLAIPLLWLAAAVWSARARTWRPFNIAVVASLAGLVGVPVAMWLYWILRWLYGLLRIVGEFIGAVLPWVLAIAIVAALLIGLGIGIYAGASAIRGSRSSGRTTGSTVYRREYSGGRRPSAARAIVFALVLVAALGVVALFGGGNAIGSLWDAITAAFTWLRDGIGAILSWIGGLLTVVVHFVIVHLLVLVVCNQFGRLVCVPLRSATRAAVDEGKCADIAAGIGMGWSLLLAAAAFDPRFNAWFTGVWQQTPVFASVPAPVGLWEAALSDSAEAVLRPVFSGFAPIVDLVMMLAVTALAMASPVLSRGTAWRKARPMDIVVPAAAAMATALIAPVISFGLWATNRN